MWPQLINLCNFGPGMGSLLPYSLNFTGLSAFPAGWTAPNWAVSSNTAKNTPTVSPTELVLNGGFDSDTANWTAGNSGTLASIAGGQAGNCLEITNGIASPGSGLADAITTTVGAWYLNTWYHKTGTTSGNWRIGTSAGGVQLYNGSSVLDANWTQRGVTIRATTTAAHLSGRVGTSVLGATTLFDTISFRLLSNLLAYQNFGAANVVIKAAWTIGATYQAGVIARMSSNGANYLLANYNQAGGTCALVKYVGATVTPLISVTTAYAAGANVEIRTNGNNVELWYNNAQVGATQAVTDVEATNTIHGLFSTDVSSTCANMSVVAN